MVLNEANVGYLPAVVLKEIKAGRKCDVTGGVCRVILNMEEYEHVLSQLRGKFGEVIQWKTDRTALIATRQIPSWAIEVLEHHIYEADEMARWVL